MSMTETIKPTRSELLRTRKRVRLAKKGHELLKRKQDSLVMELFRNIKEVKAHREMLQQRYAVAVQRINEARALESDLTIRIAAMAARSDPVRLSARSIAGVKVPQLVREPGERPVYDTLMLQEVGTAYLAVLDDILSLAAKEATLRKLLAEIGKVKRRAYALEHLMIPQLEHAARRTALELEERSREEFGRLKMRKR